MSFSTLRLLHVEDHEDTRELVAHVLNSASQVVSVPSAAEALHLVQQQKFDLYLLDTWLPDMSGIDLCRALRATDRITPILFYSGAAYARDIEAALAAGAQAYLTKPCSPEQLMSEILKVEQWRIANLVSLSEDLSRTSSELKKYARTHWRDRARLYQKSRELSNYTQDFTRRLNLLDTMRRRSSSARMV